MKLSDIKPNPDNPRLFRRDKLQKLIKSIEEFPKMMSIRPIVVDEDGTILGGNLRYEALRKMGKKTIPDDWVVKASELTEEEKRRFIVADNVELGTWDDEMLRRQYSFDELEAWGAEFIKPPKQEDYTNQNCVYPLIPEYDEKYTAIVIVCKTATEEAHIRTKLNIPKKARSYKNKYLGETNIVNASDIQI